MNAISIFRQRRLGHAAAALILLTALVPLGGDLWTGGAGAEPQRNALGENPALIWMHLSVVLLYLATRTLGLPPVGPEAGEVKPVGVLDACATASEVVLVGALGVLPLWRLARARLGLVMLLAATALLLLAHLPHLILSFKI